MSDNDVVSQARRILGFLLAAASAAAFIIAFVQPLVQEPTCERLLTFRERYDCLVERELEPGAVAYSAPDRADVGDRLPVTVRLSREDLQDIATDIEQDLGASARSEEIDVTTTMRAQLEGSAGLAVQALSPPVQRLRSTGFQEWQWEVTPTESGIHKLVLTVTAELGDEPLHHVSLVRKIHVEVNRWRAAREWLSDNWQQLLAVLAPGGALVTAGLWVIRRVRQRRNRHRRPTRPQVNQAT